MKSANPARTRQAGITILMIEHIAGAILSLTDKIFVLDARCEDR
jgi:ABC-type branched-subunit amino acid transport system ATPase component